MLTVGQLLKNARSARNIDLREAEVKTRLRRKYLEAVERDDWSVFSSKVYAIGAIKTYATFLGIDPKTAVAYYRREDGKKEVTVFRRRISRLQFLPETRKLLIFFVSAIIFMFALYFGYQIKMYLSPPELVIQSPQKRIFRNIQKIKIQGKTVPESTVTIFGEDIYPDRQGIFSYEFPLKRGKNTIIIQVVGPNGKTTQLTDVFILE